LKEAINEVDPDIRVETFLSGKAVVDHLECLDRNEMPCLIVLDYNMPLLSGLEVLQHIAGDERYENIPKIIWSTSNNDAFIRQCLSNGAKEYFIKPSNMSGYTQLAMEMIKTCSTNA
jgi:CheY-like chemotaxis protein